MVLWMHISQKPYVGVLVVTLIAISYDLTGELGVQAWTYDYDKDSSMDWETARQWCRQHFTDMVAIQNQGEIAYLNQFLPQRSGYYWIGIRKVEGVWTWVGTKKALTHEAMNWAKDEPNHDWDDCVEIYIKRPTEEAKWNDEECSKKKGTVCYTASCSEQSCSVHAECVETIGNYTCQCHPGFTQGSLCEAVNCSKVEDPVQGFVSCDHAYGEYRYNSSCQFHCARGYRLGGAQRLHCQASGHWDNAPPLCQVVECPVMSNAPSGGSMNCTHPISSYNSSCEFRCEEGFELRGSNTIQCDHTGLWTDNAPTCAAVTCDPLTPNTKGNMTCDDPLGSFSFHSSCVFTCEEGYSLRGGATLTCLKSGRWSAVTPMCGVVRCDTLKAPPHGSLHCLDRVEEFSYGSSCWLECEAGFLLNGTNSTHCTPQGNWSHTLPVCQACQCNPLKNPPHGSVVCSHPNGQFNFGSVCEVSCEEGFFLNGTTATHCTSLGTWTEKSPFCLAKQCPLVVAPERGRMNCTHPHSTFSFGSRCSLGCEEGFELTGEPIMQCTTSGLWSQELPSCQVVQCQTQTPPPEPNLDTPSPLSMNCSHPLRNFSVGSLCLFQCAEGYTLIGTGRLTCTSTGLWTGSMPTCTVEEMSFGTGMLMSVGVGAGSAAGLLLLGGLVLLAVRRLQKKCNRHGYTQNLHLITQNGTGG